MNRIHCATPLAFVRQALTVIEPGHTVVLDESAPSLALAGALAGLPALTVITTGLDVAMRLRPTSVTVILTSGQVHRPSRSIMAGDASAIPDRAGPVLGFFSGTSYSAATGLLEFDPGLAHTKRLLSEKCTTRFATLPAVRVGHFAPYTSVPSSLLTSLYLTGGSAPELLTEPQARGHSNSSGSISDGATSGPEILIRVSPPALRSTHFGGW